MVDDVMLEKMFSMKQETHPERLFVLSKLSPEDKVIYDLGCGGNKTVENAVGIDIAPGADINSSVDSLPFIKSASVDVIITRHSFEHILDPIKTMNEWKRILHKDGRIIMILPDDEFLNTMCNAISHGEHKHAYTKESFRNLISLIPGFIIESIIQVVNEWSFGIVMIKTEEDNQLDVLRNKIEKKENFSFVKMGDGEILCMMPGTTGENTDGHEYSWELGCALQEAYKFLGTIPEVHITRWKLGMEDKIADFEDVFKIKCTADHDLLLNRNLSESNLNFWKAIKESKRKKFYIGPQRLRGVGDLLSVDQFYFVPDKNAWELDGKLPILNGPVEDNSIYMFSSGFASKVWIADLLKENRNITCLDCGSAFDPMFVGQTRTGQPDMDTLLEFYKPLL